MLDLTLFKSRTYVGANVTLLLVALAMFGVFFFVSIYMQTVLGYSPVQAGAAFLPMTLLIIIIAPQAGRLADKIGSRALMTGGMALVALQLLIFSRLGADSTFWNLLPGLLVGGFGMAMTMTPSTAAAMKAVPRDKAGVGSAVLNAFRQVGGSIGVALMGAIMAARASTPPSIDGFLDGLHAALLVAATIAFVGAIVAYILVRNPQHDVVAAGRPRVRVSERGLTKHGRARHAGERLPAAERRAAVLEAALEFFSTTSYSSATTAEIARAAGISEPILYRHFASKRDLWLACLDAAWAEVRSAIE